MAMTRKHETVAVRDSKTRPVVADAGKSWCWTDWLSGGPGKETLARKRRRLGDHFLKLGTGYAGIPVEYRRDVWKTLLGMFDEISAKDYMRLIKTGRCHVYEKIKCDTFRTLATDKKFKSVVSEDQLTRVLNAFAQKSKEDDDLDSDLRFSYVQGMNVLAAPFLYVMPELDAFCAFSTFITRSCPLYVQPALEGVHCALKLLDLCLKAVDPELFGYLRGKNLSAELYAFPAALTLCMCIPPLDEALRLWDFLLCYGVHLNVLCVIAQYILVRTELLASSSPMKLLRTLPDLDTSKIVPLAIELTRRLPDDLYDKLTRHPYDPNVYLELAVHKRTDNDQYFS